MIPTTRTQTIKACPLVGGQSLALVRHSHCHRFAPPRWVIYLIDGNKQIEISQTGAILGRFILAMTARNVNGG